jgi:hypothetical protein
MESRFFGRAMSRVVAVHVCSFRHACRRLGAQFLRPAIECRRTCTQLSEETGGTLLAGSSVTMSACSGAIGSDDVKPVSTGDGPPSPDGFGAPGPPSADGFGAPGPPSPDGFGAAGMKLRRLVFTSGSARERDRRHVDDATPAGTRAAALPRLRGVAIVLAARDRTRLRAR